MSIALGVLLPFVIAAVTAPSPAPRAREQRPAGFVGSATCGTCHAREEMAWRTSDHANAMGVATAETVLGDFSGAAIAAAGETAIFERKGDRFSVRTEGPDGRVADFAVTHTFGIDPLQQYLVPFPDGRRQALPWAWDSRSSDQGGQRWFHLLPGETLRAGDPLHWTGRDQTWNFMCAACHSTGLTRGYDAAANRYDTRWSEIAVGCEACHGRGAAHVAWASGGARAGVPDKGLEVALRDRSGGAWRFAEHDPRGIARWEGPARQGTEAQGSACAACHARARPIVADPPPGARLLDTHAPSLLDEALYHADGQIKGEVFEWGSFAQSRMQRAGVVCGDCHEPHAGRLRAEGNAVCSTCHLPAKFDTASHHRHAPGSVGARCVSCHMPSATYMGIDARRDHRFAVPRPDVAASIGAPDACATCHVERPAGWAAAQIIAWFGPSRRDTPQPALAIASGRRGEPGADAALAAIATDRSQPAILRATAISLLPLPPSNISAQAVGATLRDPEPLVRAAALRALEALHPRNRLHAVAALSDDVRLVRITAASALAPVPLEAIPEAARPAFALAWDELLASERVAAERPEAHVNIAGLLAARGELAGAEASYAEALRRDPAFLPALVNLAQFEARRGRAAEAEALLTRAIGAHPSSADARYALGLAHVRAGRRVEAEVQFAEAARLRPDEPRYAYVQALALAETGRRDQAMEVLRDNLVRTPTHRDSLISLAMMERDSWNVAEAERLVRAVLAVVPNDREAAALLAQLQALRTPSPVPRQPR